MQTDPRDALPHSHCVVHKLDAQCDKPATDDRRQFITLSIHLSCRAVAKCFKFRVWNKSSKREVCLWYSHICAERRR